MENIAAIVEDGLCTGCGTCAGICPTGAIKMRMSKGLYSPEIEEDKCIACGLCFKSCPGYSIDFEELNSRIFEKQPEDRFIGNYLKCYVGHSNDKEVRYGSSSGGIATQLLIFALEKGLIDGALVTRMSKNRPLKPEPFIAKTREELISASKSKYCPVAANEALKLILEEDGRFAVVGLPCHIHGVRKAEANVGKLREKIVLHVGLFCGHTVNFVGTDVLVRKLGVRKDDVVGIDYRGLGWPGFMSIRVKDGRILKFRFNRGWNAYWNVFSPFFFTPPRCLTCQDQFNELSDVSVGDAWLPELKGNKFGESVIISRAEIGEEILNRMRGDAALSLKPISPSKVKESQAFSLKFKKENISGRLALFRLLGKKTADVRPKPSSSNLLSFLSAFLIYTSFYFSSQSRIWSLLVYVPLPLFRLYFGLFKVFFYLT